MPFWLTILMSVLPQLPQTAEEIAQVFKPHAGTDTGTKIAETLKAIAPLAGGAVQFEAAHAAASAAPAAKQDASSLSS